MKVFIFLLLGLASSQGLFLRHFQNKWDTITGWWAAQEQPQVTETLAEREDPEINLPERIYKDETSYYYNTTSTPTGDTTTPEGTSIIPNTSTTSIRKPRCRTVDSRVGHSIATS